MIQHHLPEELLFDYTANRVDEPLALLVASHLAMCAHCARQQRKLDELGGALLSELEPDALREEGHL